MNKKENLGSRIRGWFQRTRTIGTVPNKQDRISSLEKPRFLPLPPPLEEKFQRNNYIVIYMGIVFLLLGSFEALVTANNYSQLETLISSTGVNPNNFLYRDLLAQISLNLSLNLMFVILGGIVVALGLLSRGSALARELTLAKNVEKLFLIYIGSNLMGFSTLQFFEHLLSPYFRLDIGLSIAFFAFGALLVILCLWSARRKISVTKIPPPS